MDNSKFDQWLRDNLNRLEGDNIPPSDWDRMSQKLDHEDWIDAQNDQSVDFDKTIRERLSENPIPAPTDWDAMSAKLDQEFGPENLDDIILDGVVYEQLHQYKAPYNPSHWPIMEEKIESTFAIRRKLIRYKVAEVSLMLLLIFTLLQYLPYYPIKKNQAKANSTEQAQPFANLEQDHQLAKPQDITEKNSSSAVSPSETITSSDINNTLPPSTSLNNQFDEGDYIDVTKSSKLDQQSTSTETNTVRLVDPIAFQFQPGVNANGEQVITSKLMSPSELATLNLLNTKTPGELESTDYDLSECKVCPKEKTLGGWQVGMVIASDLNYIQATEAEFRFRLPDYDDMNTGYGGGLTVTIPVNSRWAFSTGLIYASASYLPNEINASLQGSFNSGYFGVGFQSARLHLLKVPIQAQYAFNPSNGRWRWYGVMGASINAAMIQEYYYQSIPEPSFAGGPVSNTRSNLASELSKEFKGLADDGQVDDNLQLTANIGLGLERYFSPRWSIFVQPVYQHDLRMESLQGFGPYRDRINSLSFYFGSKVTLK